MWFAVVCSIFQQGAQTVIKLFCSVHAAIQPVPLDTAGQSSIGQSLAEQAALWLIMQELLLFGLFVSSLAQPLTLHERRHAAVDPYVRRAIPAAKDTVIPMQIGLVQSNLDASYEIP